MEKNNQSMVATLERSKESEEKFLSSSSKSKKNFSNIKRLVTTHHDNNKTITRIHIVDLYKIDIENITSIDELIAQSIFCTDKIFGHTYRLADFMGLNFSEAYENELKKKDENPNYTIPAHFNSYSSMTNFKQDNKNARIFYSKNKSKAFITINEYKN